MYSLSYIKDPIPLVLIGGISGVGKTAVMDRLLLEYPNHFQQPISYTSRARRDEADRYVFVTETEITKLFEEGHLLNLDSAYGNLYGMSKRDIHEIRKQGKIPIKEVHPTNFQKLKRADPATITILVENKHLNAKNQKFVARQGREDEEENWASGSTDVDVVLNAAGLNPKECAHLLIKKLLSFRHHIRNLPHPSIIDTMNSSGYGQVAHEFTEGRRVTTRNFHDASWAFWNVFFRDYQKKGDHHTTLLEIGPGNGWLFNNVSPPEADIYGVDIAGEMNASYLQYSLISSARSMPFEAGFFDYVVASLADPYLYSEVIVEVGRLLKTGGYFAFTYPASYWANNYPSRRARDKTTFLGQDNQEIEVYSICRGIEELHEMFLLSELKMEMATELFLPDDYAGEVSPAISDAAIAARREVFSMPIVVGAIFRKD